MPLQPLQRRGKGGAVLRLGRQVLGGGVQKWAYARGTHAGDAGGAILRGLMLFSSEVAGCSRS